MTKRKWLLATAAAAAMGLGVSAPAQAFEEVNWSWNRDIDTVETLDISVNDTFDWSGLVSVESFQENIGDVTATSTVTDINNNPPGVGEGDTVTIDEVVTVSASYADPGGVGNTSNASEGSALIVNDGDSPIDVGFMGGQLSEQENGFNDIMDIQLSGEITLEDVEGINDAADLPMVESAATAVANNYALDSTSAVNLHAAQYNFGSFAEGAEIDEGAYDAADQTDNFHTDAAVALTLAGALGTINAGSVSATSTVSDITNASVDSDATAIGNNLSGSIEPLSEGDGFMMADLTQFNYADVTADSAVTGIAVNNYNNFNAAGFGLGEDQTALVSSVATAVGNNVSVSVGNLGNDL